MPQSYIPDQDEYLVLSYYREQFLDDKQYEEISKRFWNLFGDAADKPLRSPGTCFTEGFLSGGRLFIRRSRIFYLPVPSSCSSQG